MHALTMDASEPFLRWNVPFHETTLGNHVGGGGGGGGGGDFLNKNPDEAMDFLNYVAEISKAWDKPNPRETDRHRPPVNQKGGIFSLSEEMEMKAKLLL